MVPGEQLLASDFVDQASGPKVASDNGESWSAAKVGAACPAEEEGRNGGQGCNLRRNIVPKTSRARASAPALGTSARASPPSRDARPRASPCSTKTKRLTTLSL